MARRIERTAIVLVIFFFLFSGGCGREDPETREESPEVSAEGTIGTIVAMGDSLTEGLGVPEEVAYPALLEKALRAQGMAFRVVNAGVSGETSSGARSRINWVLSLEPDIIILETGANDGMRGIDPGLIRENIQYMIQEFISRDIVVILLGMKIMPNLGPAYADAFAGVYTSVAAENNVVFMPFMLEGVAGVSRLNQPDGIHPTADGYRKVVKNMLPYVLRAIKHQNQMN